MHRTDADGNASNLYTDGNPALGVEATVIEQHSLNALQEEIANTIEDAGVTLVKDTNDQLSGVIQTLIAAMEPQGRLTLTSATPVTTTDVTGATTIYYALHKGNHIPLYDGTNWSPKT